MNDDYLKIQWWFCASLHPLRTNKHVWSYSDSMKYQLMQFHKVYDKELLTFLKKNQGGSKFPKVDLWSAGKRIEQRLTPAKKSLNWWNGGYSIQKSVSGRYLFSGCQQTGKKHVLQNNMISKRGTDLSWLAIFQDLRSFNSKRPSITMFNIVFHV